MHLYAFLCMCMFVHVHIVMNSSSFHARAPQIIFAFWGAEELGLYGSKHFVSSLGTGGEPKREDIALDLNFDMVVSLVGQPAYVFGTCCIIMVKVTKT